MDLQQDQSKPVEPQTIEDRLAALESFAETAKTALAIHGALLSEQQSSSTSIPAILADLKKHGIEVPGT